MSGSGYLAWEMRRLCESAGLTQEAWGERIHFSGSHVGSVEPSHSRVTGIAYAPRRAGKVTCPAPVVWGRGRAAVGMVTYGSRCDILR